MKSYKIFYDKISSYGSVFDKYIGKIRTIIENKLSPNTHGDMGKWLTTLNNLPAITPSFTDISADTVTFGTEYDCSPEVRELLKNQLMNFHPWRKGPYKLFNIFIDTEWRSDLKWNRLIPHIKPLNGKKVLDVGCGNGYHCWRMVGAGAEIAIGIDPMHLYVMQYNAIYEYSKNNNRVFVLPLAGEEFPENLHFFDTVFSMGVLYHRKEPEKHLEFLHSSLKEGGELVLETLVIDENIGEYLLPEKRYAKMKNIRMIPSCSKVEKLLKVTDFKNIRLVDISVTTFHEQRRTKWMRFESLQDFLDKNDLSLTVEGYPAPKRAIFLAEI